MADLSEPVSAQEPLAMNGLREESSADKLKDLVAQATLKYSIKDYDAAAELYAFATELQAAINGEMAPANADLLYAYGRCLYHVAVKKSDVLGSKVVGEAEAERTKEAASKEKIQEDTVAENSTPKINGSSANDTSNKPAEESEGADSKPYFQFTGDENFEDSDEEDAEGDNGGDQGEDGANGDTDEDEDDFVVAYEVLDLARVLLQKRLSEIKAQSESDKGKSKSESEDLRHLKERLADTYDLQAEISLEGERFPNAVVDLRSALDLKKVLYPQESTLIAEAHYKLSLALEFSSVTQQKDANGDVLPGTEAQVDESMREEAALEMEAAISSCKLRISKEEEILQRGDDAVETAEETHQNGTQSDESSTKKKRKATKEDIDDVKDMVKDLEQRLEDLRQPYTSLNDPRTAATMADGSLSGLLKAIAGDVPAVQKVKLEQATQGATDLSGMVKRKKPAAAASAPTTTTTTTITGADASQTNGNGKRKAEDELGGDGADGVDGKRARLEEE